MKKLKKGVRANTARTTRARPKPAVIDEEEQILREATKHLILKHGSLLVATDLCEERRGEARTWIITVTLRYPTGHEGYYGDLLYDGKEFSFLTPAEVRAERGRRIEGDPALQREWNAYRAATLPARKT